MHDKVCSINLVEHHVVWGTPKWVHIATIFIRINVTECPAYTNYAYFNLFYRLLIEFRAVLVFKMDVLIHIMGEVVLHGHVKITACVLGLHRNVSEFLICTLLIVVELELWLKKFGFSVALFHGQDARFVIIVNCTHVSLDNFNFTRLNYDDFVAGVSLTLNYLSSFLNFPLTAE